MIFLDINNETYCDEAKVLIKAFYPYEEIQVLEDGMVCKDDVPSETSGSSTSGEPSQNDENPLLRVTVQVENDGVLVQIDEEETKVFYQDQDKRELFDTMKSALYQGLSKKTGEGLPWGSLTGVRPTKIVMGMLEEGMDDEAIREFLEKKYFVSSAKVELSLDVAEREKHLLEKIDYQNGYSLYVGVPFCPTTCLYCSFTSFPIGVWKKKTNAYVDAVLKELQYTAEAFKKKKLDTIYFGGGTPTTLEPEQLDRILSFIEEHFDLSNLKELTVEAGRPDSVTKEKFEVLKKHKVSRISINPQTMNQKTLDLIGRRHSVEQVIEAYELARECGFDDINMDLIVGLPGETMEDVQYTMEKVKELAPDNLTVHSLAIKRAAALKMKLDNYKNSITNTNEIIEMTAQYAKSMELNPYYLYRQKNMAGNFENVGYAKDGKEGLYNILIMEEVQTIVACGAGTVTKRVYEDGHIERCDTVKDVNMYIEKIDEMIERKRNLFAD